MSSTGLAPLNRGPRDSEGRRRRERGRGPTRGTTAVEDLGRVQRRPRGRRTPRGPGRIGAAILAVALLLLVAGGAAFAIYLHGRSDLTAALPPKPAGYAFVFVVDGLGAGDVNASSMPTLAGLAHQGTVYSNAWAGQLEATSVTANATIGTGMYPRRHGVLGQEWGSPRSGMVETPTSNTQVQLGTLDQLMQAHAGSSLASRIKGRYPTDHVVSAGGDNCGLPDAAGTWAADVVLCARSLGSRWLPGSVTGHAPTGVPAGAQLSGVRLRGQSLAARTEGWGLGRQDDWITRYTLSVVRRGHTRLCIVTFPEVELVARFAPIARRQAVLRALLRGIDRDIGRVVGEARRLRIYDRSVFVVTSDQAITPISRRLRRTRLDAVIINNGGQPVYTVADMSAFLGLRDRLQLPPVVAALRSFARAEIDAVYSKTTNRLQTGYRRRYLRRGLPPGFAAAADHLIATMRAPGSPDIVLLYSPRVGTGFLHAGPFLQVAGGAGGQWVNQHVPMIVFGHGVVQGRSSGYPAALTDVAPTVEALMGLRAGGDGVVLADAMYRPPSGSVARQQARDRYLAPLVGALQHRKP